MENRPGLILVLVLAVGLSVVEVPGVQGGKVLVFPVDGSHWINMNLLLQQLNARGHEVTVVRTASSWYIQPEAPHYRSVTINLPEVIDVEDPDFYLSFLAKMLAIQKDGASLAGFLEFHWELLTSLSEIHRQASQLVEEMFQNETLMQALRNTGFDVALVDPGLPGGVLVAHELKLPMVYNVKWITSGEGHFVVAPSPTSYVPTSGHVASDRMTFPERVKNLLFYILNMGIDRLIVCPHYDRLVQRYFGPDISFYQLLQGADMWLMRVDFVLEFPRPTMPNVAYIGGFQCRPSQPLPAQLEDFVQSSGEHGFILMSLGTLVKALPKEITSEIAAAFAELPQKVIWRHAGERPDNLGNNTLLVPWLPQNDLLGHPQVRAFVAHGGTNGLYESIYHGVPVLGLPLLFDQFENLLRLEVRGAAKVLDITQTGRQGFLEALQEILHNPSYRDKMQRLSAIHRDKATPPLDVAIFWTEFVMRHRGAAHLRSESYKMSWFVYYSLDVFCFLSVVLLALTVLLVKSTQFLCGRIFWRKKPKQE